jgi:hypothetical protein
MATPILGGTGNRFLLVAYALIALSLWTVDREIAGHSAQPTAASPQSGMPGAGPPHGESYGSFVLSQNDKFYRPASSLLDQLASGESSSAEDNDKDHDNLNRAAIALMVYLSTDGIRR